MTELILVRHGQTVWNETRRYQGQTDIPLSEEGLKQTYKLRERLAAEKIDAFYASDLKRAYETARIIAEPHKKKVILEKDLREINFGEWEGLVYEEIMTKYESIATKFYQNPSQVCIPGGEPCESLLGRCHKLIKTIIVKHPKQRVLIASHGGTIRAIILAAMKWDLSCFWRLRLDNTAISRLELYEGEKAVLRTFNDTAHLSLL